jgi:aspartyl-tRNA(Asn)/glutamyl-tRNA(Gln) amidotransferase subunit C
VAAMANPISIEEVAYVARLARLTLTAEELVSFTEQLGAVLEHARDIQALDTSEVEGTAHPLPLKNVFREDLVLPCLNRDEVLSQAPSVQSYRFRVPRIIDQ